MNFADIRSRLDGFQGRLYWRSLDELADTPEFREYIGREFPEQASEFNDPVGRRQFLKLMSASLALAGVGACTRQPPEKIIPYVRQPEEVIPGRPLFYATSMPQGGYAMPLLAENHLGRPTKLEGNPEHPAGLGATDIFGQASILMLYDPDRSHTIVGHGEFKTWPAFLQTLQAAMASQKGLNGQGLRILTEPISSPSLVDQIQTLLKAYPSAKWHQWDPVYGTVQGGATNVAALYRFDKADIVVSLDSDFLGSGAGMLRYSKDFSKRRRIASPEDQQNRLYVVEPVPTITGGKADHRLAIKASDVHAFAGALAAAAGVAGAGATSAPKDSDALISSIVRDLHAHHGRSLIVAGDHQPAAVHALARAMNEAFGNVGQTVTYTAPILASPADGVASLSELVGEMNAGKVDALIMFDGNPVFTAPADLKFADALQKVDLRVHLGIYHDETAELCHWHVPAAHYLESWGDARAFDGTVSLIQPLIAPIYDGKQAIELLAAMNGQPGVSPADLVRGYWTSAFEGKSTMPWVLRDPDGKVFADADHFWRHAVHDGFVLSTSYLTDGVVAPAAPISPIAAAPQLSTGGFEIVFRPDPTILDGRWANNGWLQELPKPLAKVTWDNVAYISPRTAEQLGIGVLRNGNTDDQDLLEITYQGRKVKLPAWVMPGTADGVIAVHFGYGRKKAGRVGTGVGVDVFPIRTSKAPWFDGGAEVRNTRETYVIAATQNHFQMEGRNPVRVVDAEQYRNDPKSVEKMGPERPGKMLSMYPAYEYNGYKWGMSIDLNACTGCSACIIACVAENNIPVVGKNQVYRTREMHWLRVDTYYEGSLDSPKTYHQPVPCQQCEDAPCEAVCPVAATVHSDEGLNDMVYNRCVGTRYCSNNCPYKVRRFNFLLYQDFETPELEPQRNPDVTIRSRGVMEKCNYCVQRISHARIDAKTADKSTIADGTVKTACQQVCPSDAIVFGNLNDPTAKVTTLKAQERNYGLLEDLGTRPRTSYLAVVRNPSDAMEKK